jgi:hypothetical protein
VVVDDDGLESTSASRFDLRRICRCSREITTGRIQLIGVLLFEESHDTRLVVGVILHAAIGHISVTMVTKDAFLQGFLETRSCIYLVLALQLLPAGVVEPCLEVRELQAHSLSRGLIQDLDKLFHHFQGLINSVLAQYVYCAGVCFETQLEQDTEIVEHPGQRLRSFVPPLAELFTR